MKYLLILFSAISFAQSPEIYGFWASQDGEYVKINYDNTFSRFKVERGSKKNIILAKGVVELVGKELRIIRKDTIDGYNLCYYIGKETLIICKPRSTKAWLWQRVGY